MSGRGFSGEYILFFSEMVAKEDMKKMAWFLKNYDQLAAENRKPRKPLTEGILFDVLQKQRAETYQTTPKHIIPKGGEAPLPKPDKTVILETMKPVPPEVHELIYHGISAEEEGRKKYLTVRYKEDPDDKFYLQDCTNWVYGWGINAVELHKLLRIPRIGVIHQSFYRRGGVAPDPDNYKIAANLEAPMFFPQL